MWEKPAPPPADWKKILLLTGLGALSWISTYTGMLELIQANMGEIGFVYKMAIGFAVAMLMLMIIWLLDQLFARLQFVVRLLFVSGYLFLTLISVGFGFGFYWKFLESRSEATRSAESAVTQVQSALLAAQTRLEQLEATLGQLTKISAQKAIDEREKGNSCPASRPGDGPRRRLRDADASRFGFAARFVSERAVSVKQDITVLNGDLAKIMKRDKSTFDPKTGTRNTFLKGLGRKLDSSVTRFNAFRTDPQMRQFRTDFADRAQKSTFDDGRGGTFSCPDPELQTALRGVVRAIDQLPELEKPKIAAVEGSEAIIEAFRRLTTTLSGLATLRVPPTPDELRAAQQRAVQSLRDVARQRQIMAQQPGLGERDYIPLFIALFVDFCLLLVSVSRPMQGFQWLEHKMGSAQDGPVIKILSRFRDIHQDEDIRNVFEVFRHVVFDVRGVYYAAIPMNGTDPTSVTDLEPESALEAQLLANLFTSFENDKVYRRVVAPLFTTGFIQKKLRAQGSKFHEAEAFRLYRFEKDQWQDWMLSAMMGAAKRVELRKRVEGELFADDAPKLKAHAEPVDESKAPSLDAPEEEKNTDEVDEAAAAEHAAFEKDIAAAIEDTLFHQAYERKQKQRRQEIAQDTKVHVLRANGSRLPEHIVPQHAGEAVRGVTAMNGAYAAAQPLAQGPAPVQPADTAPHAPAVPPVAAVTPIAPPAARPVQPAAIRPEALPKTDSPSLALRARGAWTAHQTGQHKPAVQAQDEKAPAVVNTAETATPQPAPVAPPHPAPVAAPAPIAAAAPSAQSVTPPQSEKNPMPVVQVHDALPLALQSKSTVPPAATRRIANDHGAPHPAKPAALPVQTVARTSIPVEPIQLPAIFSKGQPSESPKPAAPQKTAASAPARVEPTFANADYDDMVENITNWFSQDKANGAGKKSRN